jgi:hypothetical protein
VSDERFLQVVRGNPTAEEIAALVAVLTARAQAAAEPPPRETRSRWSAPARRLRRPIEHSPGAWRASAFPG